MKNGEWVVIYCKKCKKSTRVSYHITGNVDKFILPNTKISCKYCTRELILEKILEGEIVTKTKDNRFYV